VRADQRLWVGLRQARADGIADGLPARAWRKAGAGAGSKGPRWYDWAVVPFGPVDERGWLVWLLVRRHEERAYSLCRGRAATPHRELIRACGARWPVELAFFDSKQFLGPHDPRVRGARGVEWADPMAWFVESLTILWYFVKGHEGSHVVKDRPWYTTKVTPRFTDMPGVLQLQMWEYVGLGDSGEDVPSLECIERLL
jgi:hypothetical protein